MIKPIVKDTFFLSQPCEEATDADLQTMLDLSDTLKSHADHCAGLAANMIGAKKRIIALYAGPLLMVMVNPEIKDASRTLSIAARELEKMLLLSGGAGAN